MKLIIIIVATIGSAAIAQNWYLHHKVSDLTKDRVKLETAIQSQSESVNLLQATVSDVISVNNQLTERMSAIDNHRTVEIGKLNSFRGRLADVALAKPALIERRANDSFTDLLREFTQATANK